jgi:hypothetical protein
MGKNIRIARKIRQGARRAMERHALAPRPPALPVNPEIVTARASLRRSRIWIAALVVALGVALFARFAHAGAVYDPTPTWLDVLVWVGLCFSVLLVAFLLSEIALAVWSVFFSKGGRL